MRTRLVKIGNSRGIRLPKSVIEQAGLDDEVELEIQDDGLVIKASKDPRAGWAEACRQMHEHGDDALIDGPLPSLTKFDEKEWEW